VRTWRRGAKLTTAAIEAFTFAYICREFFTRAM
jgi:hypothetical protein